MSLLDATAKEFVIMDKVTAPDGYGGYTTTWTEGATIRASLQLNNSMQARIGEKQGVTSVFTVHTSKNIVLNYHDVIRRKEDGQYFRITSNGADKATPKTASLDIRSVTAEKWELTSPYTPTPTT